MRCAACCFLALLLATALPALTWGEEAVVPQPHHNDSSLPKQQQAVLAVVLVGSSHHDAHRRSAVRRQWARSLALLASKAHRRGKEPPTVVLRFMLGMADHDAHTKEALHKEQDKHGDMLLMEAVADWDVSCDDKHSSSSPRANCVVGKPGQREVNETKVPSAVTLKTLEGLRWAVSNYRFKYAVRTGDDAYLRIEKLAEIDYDNQLPRELAYMGAMVQMDGRVPWERDWCLVESGTQERRATHCIGAFSYGNAMFTEDVASWIADAAPMLRTEWPEDKTVATWLVGTRATFYAFNSTQWFDWCPPGCFNKDAPLKIRRNGPPSYTAAHCNDDKLLLVHKLDTWNRIRHDGLLACCEEIPGAAD